MDTATLFLKLSLKGLERKGTPHLKAAQPSKTRGPVVSSGRCVGLGHTMTPLLNRSILHFKDSLTGRGTWVTNTIPTSKRNDYIFPPQAKETIYRIESSEQHLPTFQLAVRSQVTVSGITDLVSMSQLMCAGFAMVEGPPFFKEIDESWAWEKTEDQDAIWINIW